MEGDSDSNISYCTDTSDSSDDEPEIDPLQNMLLWDPEGYAELSAKRDAIRAERRARKVVKKTELNSQGRKSATSVKNVSSTRYGAGDRIESSSACATRCFDELSLSKSVRDQGKSGTIDGNQGLVTDESSVRDTPADDEKYERSSASNNVSIPTTITSGIAYTDTPSDEINTVTTNVTTCDKRDLGARPKTNLGSFYRRSPQGPKTSTTHKVGRGNKGIDLGDRPKPKEKTLLQGRAGKPECTTKKDRDSTSSSCTESSDSSGDDSDFDPLQNMLLWDPEGYAELSAKREAIRAERRARKVDKAAQSVGPPVTDNIDSLIRGPREPFNGPGVNPPPPTLPGGEDINDPVRSMYVSWVLDILGYGANMRQYRRVVYRERDRMENGLQDSCTQITAGSKGEGLTAPFENDTDQLNIDHHYVCIEPGVQLSFLDTVTVFTMDMRECLPGYTRLKLHVASTYLQLNKRNFDTLVSTALFSETDGSIYVSSTLYSNAVHTFRTQTMSDVIVNEMSGPATPFSRGLLNADYVLSFRCICPSILRDWASRPRPHDWPPPHLIQQLSQHEGQIVATGSKGSDNNWREWRLCFIPTERELLCSLSDTQTKLYVILKYVKSNILSIVCSEMSSYIMKNVVFWMCELHPVAMFTPQTLLYWLKESLIFLRTKIMENNFPYYMIPGRNLLHGRFTQADRDRLCDVLTHLINDVPLGKLGRLGTALYHVPPVDLRCYHEWRTELESLHLLCVNIQLSYRRDLGEDDDEVQSARDNDANYRAILVRMNDMVWPQWRQHTHQPDFQDVSEHKLQSCLC